MHPGDGNATSDEIAQLHAALADHQKLWRETNHRFQNSLQILSSIISMRLRETDGHDFRWTVVDLRYRLGALATIYQGLGAFSDPRMVYADVFLPAICNQMASPDGGEMTVSSMVPRVAIGVDAAVVLAMLTIEAIQLAARHGNGEKLRIFVQIFSRESGLSTLIIANDASGGGNARKFPRAEALIAGYVRQLRGEFMKIGQGGRALRVDFPVLH